MPKPALAPLALLLAILPLSRRARADTTTPAPGEEEALYHCKRHPGEVAVSLKPKATVEELVTWVMSFTCKNFVLDPRVVATGREVELVTPTRLTADEAYRVFVEALATMGLTVAPGDHVLRIVEAAQAKQQALPIYQAGGPGTTNQVVRYVLRPTYARPDVLAQAFKGLASQAGELQVVGSLVLVTDYASNVRDMMSLAKLIDVPDGTGGIYTLPVRHADATKLAAEVGKILEVPGARTATAARGGAGGDASPGEAPAKLVVDARTNTLVVTGSPAAFQRVAALVDRLDVPLEIDGSATFHVYQVKSAIAEELAKTLNDAISRTQAGAAPAAGARGAAKPEALALEGQAHVIADAPTNKLIVVSSGRDFLAIQDMIRQLDQPRREVYIEAVLLEVGVDHNLDLGASAHGALPTRNGSSLVLGGVQLPGLSSLDISSLAAASGLIGGVLGQQLTGWTMLGQNVPSYGILFQALASQTHTNILSAPSIIALDNVEAKYRVGVNVPYKKGVLPTSSTNPLSITTTNIDREPLDLELDIKPHISDDDSVLLEIKQQSKDLASNDPELGPTWSERSLETRIVVRDQQTVVIGGLVQQREDDAVSKVPLLGDIPLLGRLFSYTTRVKKKSDLLVMLTPYIVKDQLDLEAIRARKVREHDEFLSSVRTLGRMPYDPAIDYRRKRGLVEEIDRAVEGVEHDVATRAALDQATGVVRGPVELPPAR